MKNLVTIANYAKIKKVSRVTVYAWIESGKITITKVGGKPFIELTEEELK